MLLWVGFAVLSAGVLAALLNPLLRSRSTPATGDAAAREDAGRDLALYRDQLAEIDAERERGQIGETEAEAAKAEVARRLIAAEDRVRAAATAQADLPSAAVARVAAAVSVIVPLAAIGFYLMVGSPQLPAQPWAERIAQVPVQNDIARLIATVEARLRQHPEDGQGWDVIAPVYLRMSRYAEAADAFERAIRLLGESPKRLAGFAESSVLAKDGIVTEPARKAYEKLHKLEPQRPEPRFWLALAKEQDGQLKEALADYQALLKDGDPKATWRPLVEERVAEMRQRLGQPDGAPPAALPKKEPEPKGPTADDVAAAEKMAAADRQRMIEDMVQGLAARLEKDGRDLAGWQRLIRAYAVMGRKSDAVAALGRARGHFASEPQSLGTLTELARALGLDS